MATTPKRVLVCGDLDGDLEKLYADVERQQASHGKFDLLIACGKFLPAQKTQHATLQEYVTGKKEVPIPTYFIDSDSQAFMTTAYKGRDLGNANMTFLGAFGVREIHGLRIGFISGRMGDNFDTIRYHDDGTPMHINGQYNRGTIDAMKQLAEDGPLDILVSSEWAEGVEVGTGDEPVDPAFSSPAIRELCQAFEPRFHAFAMAGKFYRRKPYLAEVGGHVCRPVGLGKVGMKGMDKKWLHALIIVPRALCKPAALMRGENEATPCPFPSATQVGTKRPRPVANGPPSKLARVVQTPAGFNVRKDGVKWVLDIHLGKGRRFSIETGEVFKQAGGAVVVRDGETQVWGTTCSSKEPTDKDFLPLTVEYKERSSGGGKTPGGFIKRDKPMCEDHEILVCRFTDRPLRPLFPETWSHETQILLFTMCYDDVHPPEPLAICAASASALISDIPLKRPIAGVMVAMTSGGEFIVNPTTDERRESKMQIMVAGTTEAVSMIEMSGDFVTEEQFLAGVMVGHDAIKVICRGLIAFDEKAGKTKKSVDNSAIPPALPAVIDRKFGSKVDALLRKLHEVSATVHEEKVSEIEKEAIKELGPAEDGTEKVMEFKKKDIVKAFKKMSSLKMMKLIEATGKRVDGRRIDEVREIGVKQRYLSRCHGTSLFTRGDTQSICTCTLGDSAARQRVESIVDPESRRFYLQYFFPPSCVGDVKRMGKGRREVGHGNLAERAVRPSVPDEKEFPYTIRTESFISESCGSSSMASVCGASLAMIDAGVPVKCMVSGIAMGLVDVGSGVAGDNAIILSDIAELEDFIGKMDFKVAGNEVGISAVQLDVKNEGLTRNLFARALEQAKGSRLHILEEMKKHVTVPENPTLPPNVPRIVRIEVSPDAKGKIIGPGGSNIRKMIDEFKLTNIHVDDDYCEISCTDEQVLETVKMVILDIVAGTGGDSRGRASFASADAKLTMPLDPSGKGKLIGKGGQTINGLIREFSLADIKIQDNNTVDIIGGTNEQREECRAKIDAMFEGPVHRRNSCPSPSAADDTMTIPAARIGKVVGRGGNTIQLLIGEYGLSDIKIQSRGSEGVVEMFGGTDAAREECKRYIENLVTEGENHVVQPVSVPKRPHTATAQPVFTPVVRPSLESPVTVPKARSAVKAGSGLKVSEDLKMKMQMEFAEMCPGDTRSYRLLPHEVNLATELASAFDMNIEFTGANGEYIVSRPEDEGY